MGFRSSNTNGNEWPKYGTIVSDCSAESHSDGGGSVHVKDDRRFHADEEDDDHDDAVYTRFVRLRNESGNFLVDGLSHEQLKVIVNLVINMSEW